MSNLANFSFEPAYRQLDQAARAFVDDFVTRVEAVSERENRELFDVLGDWPSDMLSARDIDQLGRVLVKTAVFERIRDLTEQQNVSPRKVLKEIAAIAFGNIDHFRKTGSDEEFSLEYATPEQRKAVKEVEIVENTRSGQVRSKYKLHDKMGALRLLAQINGLLDENGNPIASAWKDVGPITASDTTQSASEKYGKVISG